MEQPFDMAAELIKQPHVLEIPGNLLMKGGPEDYIGAVLCLRATLYFKDAHTPLVREALCKCFDEFQLLADGHLTWLVRDNPPQGERVTPYAQARNLRAIMGPMGENDFLSVHYTSGKQSQDASPWLFSVLGPRAWQANMGNNIGVLEFSVPLLFQEQNPLSFLKLFYGFARRINPQQGYAGHAFNLSVGNQDDNQPTEAFMAARMPGLDVGSAFLLSGRKTFKQAKIKTVSWLTLLDNERLESAGGLEALRAQLPASHFAFYTYNEGVIIQSGAHPYIAGDAEDLKPAPYVLINHLLKPVRYESVGSLHGNSHMGELRLVGWSADQWLKRLDVDNNSITDWRVKLLRDEPHLDSTNSLAERL